ncbi:EspA/EspE family type VII secretion system effector, partial [Mycobacterium sp. 050134]|uniref:EspA/EspE family type VII secretion system effector n=1 Tax=Mycobacterium sp. 050134 TaxID=3096111 RepID=UPI002EDAD708
MALTTGLAEPYPGSNLKAGSAQWMEIHELLGSAYRGDSWQGSAAQAYAGQIADQQDRARVMADLDSKLADIVKDQADWTNHVRMSLGILTAVLSAAYVVEQVIRFNPALGGTAVAIPFAVVVCMLGITAAMGMITT